MSDDLNDYMSLRGPVAGRPLSGLTILAVEDSRFACEAIRLLALRSGARIRRADCLRSARRHLQVYRPAVAIIDLGLPDGSGIDLIAELADAPVRVPAIIATSGDPAPATPGPTLRADGFLAKPVESLAVFQRTILTALAGRGLADLRLIAPDDVIRPDTIALRDDLSHMAQVLEADPDAGTLDYVAQFLSGVARSARDPALARAADALTRDGRSGQETASRITALSGLVRDRLQAGAAF